MSKQILGFNVCACFFGKADDSAEWVSPMILTSLGQKQSRLVKQLYQTTMGGTTVT